MQQSRSKSATPVSVALDIAKGAVEVTPDPLMKPFEKGYLYLELLLHTDKPPAELFRHVAVTFSK